EQQRLLPIVRQMQLGVADNNTARARDAACRLLGLGRGLTASGDDFILGFLLLRNRWPANHADASWAQTLNQAIVDAAYARTTTLSANLIECATRGESDER